MYSRVRFFFGDDNFAKLQNAFVIVVGLGGVGNHIRMHGVILLIDIRKSCCKYDGPVRSIEDSAYRL